MINEQGATIQASGGGEGIYAAAAGVNVTNNGTILQSGGSAVVHYLNGGTFTQGATGQITSTSTTAVGVADKAGTLTGSNAGTITVAGAAALQYFGTSTGTFTNTGTLSGITGVLMTSSNVVNLINMGTITGTGGTAISITGNGDGLTLGTGTILNGNVTSTGTGNTLTLTGSASTASNLTGFSTLTMNGTDWTLGGTTSTTSTTAAATLIQSGTLTITRTLNNTGAGASTTIDSGAALQLGNGGATGSLTGNVVDNGSFVFNESGTNTVANTISGTGTVGQIGTGTTVLTADNTYTGTTTISAGTLQLGNGGTTGSVVSDVVDNGVLAIDNAGTVTLPGVISGSGALQQNGTGTAILTADNSYTGNTMISAGTLQLGDGGTSGSIVSNVVDNGTLSINQSGTATLPGAISGSGSLLQAGTGTTILTRNESYAGGTTISAGTLQLGNGGTTGSILGNVTDDGTLAFNRSNMLTFPGVISGTGSLTQNGSTTVLTGENTYTGGTTIGSGSLQLGNGGTTGSIVGNVTDNGSLIFFRSDTSVFAGVISGTGSVYEGSAATSGTVLTGDNTYTGGTTIASGTLQLGDGGATGSIVGDVSDKGALVVDRSGTVTLPGVISGSGSLSQVGNGTTVLANDNTYTGGTTISAGTLQLGNGGATGSIVGNVTDNGMLTFNRSDDITYSDIVSGSGGLTQLGPGTLTLQGAQTYTGPTNALGGVLELDGSIQSATSTVGVNGTLSGFGNVFATVTNQGTVWPGHAIAGDTNYGALTIHGNYVGENGVLELNTFLGVDGSPSDQLVINGGTATGSTTVIVHNTNTSSGETTGNGILVVSAVNGATTASNAFQLGGEDRGGALDYDLFRGAQNGTDANSWYLRNDFVVPGPSPTPEPLQGLPVLPATPPPASLPPGVYPIIGPEVATYAAVHPVAANLGLMTLGTMDERIGDSALMASADASTDAGPSVWARVLASTMNNTYLEFAAPRVTGNLSGMQVGADIWQGQAFPGQSDRFGGYLSYGNADMSVRGLIANVANLDYVRVNTGTVDLHATSAGAYFTHYGNSGWYLDAVTQFTSYNGRATTQYDTLPTKGTGIVGSLEYGYPFALPQLGSSFVLEPQVQAIWQHTNFGPSQDSESEIQLGSTDGTTGRLGLRGKWQITTQGGQVWSPYVTTNFWRDWGGRSATVFGANSDNTNTAPMVPQATRGQLEGGITAQLLSKLIVYGSLGYEHQLSNGANAQREGFDGQVGLRYTW